MRQRGKAGKGEGRRIVLVWYGEQRDKYTPIETEEEVRVRPNTRIFLGGCFTMVKRQARVNRLYNSC